MGSRNRYTKLDLPPELIEIANRKAGKMIRIGAFSYDDFEDLQQELILSLWKAMESYESTGKKDIINKEAFAQAVVNKKAQDLIDIATAKKRGKGLSIRSLHDSISNDQDYLLIDTITETSTFYDHGVIDFVEQVEFEMDLELIISKLPKDLKEIYELSQSMNIDEILKIKKISRRTFYRKIEVLRQILSNSGFSK